ncbi:MAG: TerC family protein [Lysobacterales bacterium]|nr:TerC family protein [Xanthomonadales bacterium]MCB1614250.1 TerC family protein [Xanthomonadales bacterium]MCP5476400.1 TerC family protein [Rhodanobacteraceae bacterium]
MEQLFTTEGLIALLTLSTLEIVLGIDNLVFLSIVTGRLAPEKRPSARRFGIALACVTRIMLLLSLAWLAGMTHNLFKIGEMGFSIRDLVLIVGGLFLLVKATMEIHAEVEGDSSDEPMTRPAASFWGAIIQIAVIDIVFSLDSVITAVGMVNNVPIMVTAILVSVGVMLLAANPVAEFIERRPTLKMLALSFLILVGVALIADGFDFHIPRAYLYFAMAFSGGVEALNILARRRSERVQIDGE